MASYVPVTTADADFSILNALDSAFRKYAVTYTKIVGVARTIYGAYRTQRQAFAACRQALRRTPGSAPLCFLIVGANYFKVVADNAFTH